MTWKFEESSNYSTFISKHYTYDNPGKLYGSYRFVVCTPPMKNKHTFPTTTK